MLSGLVTSRLISVPYTDAILTIQWSQRYANPHRINNNSHIMQASLAYLQDYN